MKKLTKIAIVCALSAVAAGTLVACGDKSPKYTVTFDTRGGSEIASYTLAEGKTVDRPKTTPTKDMFVFDDWYTDTTYTTVFEFGAPMPAYDITVYAGWIGESSVNITYNANGGVFGDTAEKVETGNIGADLNAPTENPTRYGYVFGGWYTDVQCTKAYTFGKYPSENITLYANWNKDGDNFAYISYYGNSELMTVMPVKKGESITDPQLFGSDIESDLWYTNADMTNPYASGVADVNFSLFTAYYTKGLVMNGNTVTGYNGTATDIIVPHKFNGQTITAIGEYAFATSHELTQITSVSLPSTVTTISEGAFYDCQYLVSVNLSDKVTAIGDNAFWSNNRLKSFGDISSVTTIGAGAFTGCSVLRSFELPSGLTSIGDSAFAKCDELTEMTLPIGITEIADDLFNGCKMLVSVDVTSPTLSRIGKNAFASCSSLERVTLRSVSVPEFTDYDVAPYFSPFKGSDKVKIYVPSALVSVYQDKYGYLDDGAINVKFTAIE